MLYNQEDEAGGYSMHSMKKRLGDILLEKGFVDGRQLSSALDHQRKWGVPLGQVVVDLRLCTAGHVLEALAHQTGVPSMDLDSEPLNALLAQRMPRPLAERHRVVPLRMEGPRNSVLVVAIAAPASLQSLDAVRHVMSYSQVEPRLATDAAISRAIERLYQQSLKSHDALELEDTRRLALVLGTPFAEPPVLLLSEEDVVDEKPAPPPWAAREVKEGPGSGEVLLYGWGKAAAAMEKSLKGAGFQASVADTAQVLAADPSTVVLLPLPWLEMLEQQPRARLLVAGKGLGDRIKAQILGASGFLVAPVESGVLIEAVEQMVHTLH